MAAKQDICFKNYKCTILILSGIFNTYLFNNCLFKTPIDVLKIKLHSYKSVWFSVTPCFLCTERYIGLSFDYFLFTRACRPTNSLFVCLFVSILRHIKAELLITCGIILCFVLKSIYFIASRYHFFVLQYNVDHSIQDIIHFNLQQCKRHSV